jgi:agmatine/peptidylarginine deiminase
VVWIAAVGVAACLASSSFPEQPASTADPDSAVVRVAAEWEPVMGALIAWPLKLPAELVVALAEEVDLYVTARDSCNAQCASAQFRAWGIDPQRVHFVITSQGSGYYVTRDWGPFAVFGRAGDYNLVDGRFIDYAFGTLTGRRLYWIPRIVGLDYRADDQAPLAVARALGYPARELPIALVGGNIAFDGQGTAFATEILREENRQRGISADTLLAVARQELGVQQFHFLPKFERLGIQHLDCLLKLLDEERILVKRPPPDHPAHQQIERIVCELSRLTSVYGRPYQILRIDTPRYRYNRLANYTNALIVNRSVFVPLFAIPADAMALRTWGEAMPGYRVRGFVYDDWRNSDALHCRVRGIWDPGMLYLAHRRLDALVGSAEKLDFTVQIRDYSGAGLIEEQLHLVWRTQGGAPWNRTRLQPTAQEHEYHASITAVPTGQTVEYYLAAASRSGRHETLPRTAPEGVYLFTVGPLDGHVSR